MICVGPPGLAFARFGMVVSVLFLYCIDTSRVLFLCRFCIVFVFYVLFYVCIVSVVVCIVSSLLLCCFSAIAILVVS